ncbi:hypothetical protein [Roseobacter cerasinus]|uniref:hypothetical protein n=1 Tax=Roseobacter cerasinus TaxID=2602289 RepID=UPI00135C2441|nr:hypothetical protein [Roseobacter cerasinus]
MKFSQQQFIALEAQAAAGWDRETAKELQALYSHYMAALGVALDDITAFVRTVRDYAQAYHITSKREVFKLAVIGVSLGAHFPHDPRFEHGVASSLGRTGIPQNRRLVLLSDFVETWLGATWTGEGLDVVGARLVARIDSSLPLEAALRGLVAQSPSLAPRARRKAFLDACLVHADGYGLRTPERRLAYVGAALIHGIYWFDDPLMGGLRRIVAETETPDLMRDQMAEFYAGFA